MAVLKVANVHFNQTGVIRRIELLSGESVIRFQANAVQLPIGNTNFRPPGGAGLIRYNSETGTFEGHNASSWGAIAGSGGDATLAFGHANLAFAAANASFAHANSGHTHANQAFAHANAAHATANAAFGKANAALVNTSTTLGGTLSLTAYTLLGGTYSDGLSNTQTQTLTDQATVTWDGGSGRIARVVLGGNRVIANVTNLRSGTYILFVRQDGVGGRTVTWANGYKFPANVKPTLTATAGGEDIMTFVSDGTNLYGTYINNV